MADNEEIQRVAVVTGASRGIGAEIARMLAAQGSTIVLVARDAARLDRVAAEIESAGGRASVHPCDVSDQPSLEKALADVADTHKRLDILINNAGITRDNLVLRMSDEEFDAVVQTNLRSVFVACRAALRTMMRGKWGRIINISSVAGVAGNAGQANYAAAKSGLFGLTKSLAREMAAKNITANVVAPGFVETDMTEDLPQQVKDAAIAVTPLRRFGRTRDIAAAVAFLASEDAGFITGQVIAIDGGMTMA